MAELGQNSVKGTGFKVNVNMTPINNFHMSDVEWECLVFTETSQKNITIKKSEAIKVDQDNYILKIDSSILGAGMYYITLTAYIPDSDFEGGMRTERRTVYSGVKIDAR
jgi:hypothetical protein